MARTIPIQPVAAQAAQAPADGLGCHAGADQMLEAARSGVRQQNHTSLLLTVDVGLFDGAEERHRGWSKERRSHARLRRNVPVCCWWEGDERLEQIVAARLAADGPEARGTHRVGASPLDL